LRPAIRIGLTGSLLGLAVLTRGEAMFYLPVVVFAVWSTTRGNRRLKLVSTGGVVAVCAVVILPWLVRNHVVMGAGTGLTTTGGVNFYFGHNATRYGYHSPEDAGLEEYDEVARQREAYRRGMAYVSSEPVQVFRDVATGTRELLVNPGYYSIRASLVIREFTATGVADERKDFPYGTRGAVKRYYRVLAILAVFGLVFARRIGRQSAGILYGVVFMNWLCYSVVFWSKPRFRYTSEVMMCVLAAFVLCAFWDEWKDWLRQRKDRRV
jgi:4-amino-4-deoxy-L-arabinose transferase-like glycosyltransferase